MSKKRKSDRCSVCGEKGHPLKTLTLAVDGQKRGGWRLCRPCLATTLVAIVAPVKR